MLRRMSQIEVEVMQDKCEIYIRQGNEDIDEDIILLHADQVDLLIKWLLEAKLELIERG